VKTVEIDVIVADRVRRVAMVARVVSAARVAIARPVNAVDLAALVPKAAVAADLPVRVAILIVAKDGNRAAKRRRHCRR